MTDEGVIKFTVEHTHAPPIVADTERLNHWRSVCFELGIIGEDPMRYGGAGFGNVSQRLPSGFLISGTQTGRHARLSDAHWVAVTAHAIAHNRVVSHGPMLPSSEAMTHGMLYDMGSDVGCVIHVHSPLLWQRDDLPQTAADVAYGTPAMAREVLRLWPELQARRVFAMRGHEDGVIAFGCDADEAGKLLQALMNEAPEQRSR